MKRYHAGKIWPTVRLLMAIPITRAVVTRTICYFSPIWSPWMAGAAAALWVAQDWRFHHRASIKILPWNMPPSLPARRRSKQFSLRAADSRVTARLGRVRRLTAVVTTTSPTHLPALDRAYLRPRYPGYLHFQDHAGDPVRDYLMHGGNPKQVLAKMTKLYLESKELTS